VAVILEVAILVLVVATRFSARAIIRPAHRRARASSRGASRQDASMVRSEGGYLQKSQRLTGMNILTQRIPICSSEAV
jgi:hypothetical protein